MSKTYSDKDIKVLSDRDHVRQRTQIYLGNTNSTTYSVPIFLEDKFTVEEFSFIPAVYKSLGEIIDNSLDEFAQTPNTTHDLRIEANPLFGQYTVADNGRGVPIGKHESGPHTPEVVFGQLRSGRNFSDDREVGTIGMNGVGSSCVCAVSQEFQVKIQRDKKVYEQSFKDGALNISPPSIRRTNSPNTGTEISFTLDGEVFSDIVLPDRLVHNRAIEIALTNPGTLVTYNGHKYKFKKGFDDYIKTMSSDFFKFEDTDKGLEFYVTFDINNTLEEQMFTWLNSSYLFDQGIANTQFLNAFVDHVTKHLQPLAKKQKSEVTRNDIRQGLLILGNLRIANPQYDSQAKTRMVGPNLRNEMQALVDNQFKQFIRHHKGWLDRVLERAMVRHHAKANQKAIKEHQKTLRKKVPGLVDATHKDRSKCQILITEGLSASSMITEARDPTTTATFALTGKINNTYGTTPAQLLQMGKVTNLLSAIGLVPGKKALRSELRFGKIVIATDADVDGDDIFTLLVNLFYQFWPELFSPNYEPVIYRLSAPNVCCVKGKERVHYSSRREYEANKGKHRGHEIRYYKGLGSMQKADWEMILSDGMKTLIPVVDDGKLSETMVLLFGPDSDMRKRWLQDD